MKRTLMVALLGMLGAAPAFAQSAPAAPVAESQSQSQSQAETQKGARFDKLAAKLGLDDAQTAEVRATFEKYRAQMMPIRQQLKQTRAALQAELANAQPDETKVASLTAQLQSGRRQMVGVAQARSAELQKELTPTQYAKLVLHHRHRFGRGGHFGHWNRAPQGAVK